MGKVTKTATTQQSAFVAYKQERDDISSKLSNSGDNKKDEDSSSRTSVSTTNSIIKQLSNQAATKLKHRTSLKRKKKVKINKLQSNGTVSDREMFQWKSSKEKNGNFTSTPLFPLSNTCNKPFIFGITKGGIRASIRGNKKSHGHHLPKVYENSKTEVFTLIDPEKQTKKDLTKSKALYKEGTDRSIEMSTSQSLTGLDEDDSTGDSESGKQTNDKENHIDSLGLNMEIDISTSPPPNKKSKRSQSCQKLDQTSSSSTSYSSKKSSHMNDILSRASKVLNIPLPCNDSEKNGECILKWLIFPMTLEKFFSTMWEKKPFLVRRNSQNYTNGLFSIDDFNEIMHKENIRYGVNLDVTSYKDGQRETHNPEGRVYPSVAWDYYKNGCSLRFLNPQAYSTSVWQVCASLQEYFKAVVGANIYLTPAGTQGFAPHYDDIEAFIIQLEGRKHWKLYSARPGHETLPRYSSRNFTGDEIGKEIFDAILDPGDLLYFPRGIIHQGKSLPDTHSLHITISTYQKNTWADVMEQIFPEVLQCAINDNVEFRQGLPLDYLSCFGHQNHNKIENAQRRKEIFSKFSDLCKTLTEYCDLDNEADNRASDFSYDCLPPALTQSEKARSIAGANINMAGPGNPGPCQLNINQNTNVRLLRKNIIRLIVENNEHGDKNFIVHHSVQNSRIYHAEERKSFEVTEECFSVLKYLLEKYPAYVPVRTFPPSVVKEKIILASALFERGIIMTQDPITMEDDKSDTNEDDH